MILELLDQEDFDDLHDDSGPRWVALEKLARQRLSLILNTSDTGERSKKAVTLQYMKLVTVLAEEAGIQGISIPPGQDPAAQVDSFMVSVQAAAARIWMNNRDPGTPFGIAIATEAKAAIRDHIAEIRAQIPALKLTDREQVRLTSSLEDFSRELELPRSRFSIGSGHLVVALTVLNLAVTTTAAGPDALDAIQKIQAIWGEQKEQASSAMRQISHTVSPKLLPGPQKQISAAKENP